MYFLNSAPIFSDVKPSAMRARADSKGRVVESIEDSSLKNCAPVAVFSTGVMSPTFIDEIILSTSSFISSREIGPMRPPLAFEGESETSAATFSNASPLTMRARMSSAFSRASSIAPTLATFFTGSAGIDLNLAKRHAGRGPELDMCAS